LCLPGFFVSGGKDFFIFSSELDLPGIDLRPLCLLPVVDFSELVLLLVAIELFRFGLLSVADRSDPDIFLVAVELCPCSLPSITGLIKAILPLCVCSFSTVERSRSNPLVAESDTLRRGTLLLLPLRFLMAARALRVADGRVILLKIPRRDAVGASVSASFLSATIAAPLALVWRATAFCRISAKLVPAK
jgi:hypothetical protein